MPFKPTIVHTAVLSQLRVEFTQSLCELVLWAREEGYELAFGEGYVALTDGADGDHDGPHMDGGSHYTGLGHDMILYRGGSPVTNSEDVSWVAIGTEWKRRDDRACWGGDFKKADAGHFSFLYQGKA